jgi:hypothetical protein
LPPPANSPKLQMREIRFFGQPDGRCSQSLRDKKSVWSLGLALAIEAGVKTASGHNDSAQTLWADAERELERSGMRMFAAAARCNRSVVLGDNSAVRLAEVPILEQGVREPANMARVLLPGIQA